MRYPGHAVFVASLLFIAPAACSTFTASEPGATDDAATESSEGPDGTVVDSGDSAESGNEPAPDAGVRKRVFVTSTTYAPSQLGSAGSVFGESDGLCNQLAQALTPPGTFRAWISDGTTAANDRKVFVPPYWDVTGNVAVFDANGSFSGAGLISELKLPAPTTWWTGMASPTAIGDTCGGWSGDTTPSGSGSVGSVGSWSGSMGAMDHLCQGNFSGLLCFEQ